MASRGITPLQQTEVILASEADRRVSTANGRPSTSSSTNQNKLGNPPKQSADSFTGASLNQVNKGPPTPDNTPRQPDDSISEIVSLMETGVKAGWNEVEDVLDHDEMFMTLTDEERSLWEEMMKKRSDRLNLSKEQHDKWVDSFTRRRMFAYSRMRKLQDSFKSRSFFLAQMSESMARVSKTRSQTSLTMAASSKKMEKRLSEPTFGKGSSNSQTLTETDGIVTGNPVATEVQSRPGVMKEARASHVENQTSISFTPTTQTTITTATTTATKSCLEISPVQKPPPGPSQVKSNFTQQPQQDQRPLQRPPQLAGNRKDQENVTQNGSLIPAQEITPFVKVEPVDQLL